MSYCRLENAGVYRATLEAMLFGAVTKEAEGQKFNDSVLEKKEKKVGDLVARFDKNLVMESTEMEVKPEPELQETTPTPKPRSKELSMESFVAGILRASSPIPQETPEVKAEQELQETPILPYRPAKFGSSEPEITPEVIPTHPVKPRPLQLQAEATKAYRTALKSQGRAKVAEVKGFTIPRTQVTVPALQGSPDSAYFSPGSSAASSAASTPLGPSAASSPTDPSTHSQAQDPTSEQSELAQTQTEEPDIYLKLARAQLHKTIKEYATWEAETVNIMAETAASRRIMAL
ncbi:unnamed protein product [Caenorhabditis brenneri]